MKNRLVVIIFMGVVLATIALLTVFYWSTRGSGTSLISFPSSNPLQNVSLSTDIADKKLMLSDKVSFSGYLDKISFWNAKTTLVGSDNRFLVPEKQVDIKKLNIFVTDKGQGYYDRFIDSEKNVLTSFSLTNTAEGEVNITIHLNPKVLGDIKYGNQLLNTAALRAIYIVKQNRSVTSQDLPILNDLESTYQLNTGKTFIELRDKNVLGLTLVKTAHAGCLGGVVECGYLTYWRTCGGNLGAKTCRDDGDCSNGLLCLLSSQCTVDWASNCANVVEANYCSATSICGFRCVAEGSSCYWSGTTPSSTPTPSCDCGSQQCDYSIPTGKCQYKGCKTSTGANCVKYTCGGSTPTYNPIGYHDSSYCDYSYGWTCDQDNFSTPLTVNFYKDGPPGTGTFIGSTLANVAAERIGF